jgi:O-antigen ligase
MTLIPSNKLKISLLFLLVCFYLNPFNVGFIFGYLTLLLMIFNPKLKLATGNSNGLILLFFSIVYSVFYSFEPELGIQFIFLYALIPFVMYSAGSNFSGSTQTDIVKITFLLGVILSLPSLISVLLDVYKNGFVTLKRDVPNIWTGETEPATNTAGKLLMNMCIPSLLLINWRIFSKNNWFSISAVLIFILSITTILRLGSRTHLGIIIFTLFFAIIYKIVKKGVLKNILLIGALFIILNFSLFYLSLNADSDFLSAYADRMDSRSHGVSTAGGRSWKWEKSAEYIFTKPIGWQIDDIGLSHNLWLDTARVSGILGFFLLALFTIKTTIASFKKILQKYSNKESYNLEGLLLIYILAFNLLFFVEPIMEGYFSCFTMFCFIAGIQSNRINQYNNAAK